MFSYVGISDFDFFVCKIFYKRFGKTQQALPTGFCEGTNLFASGTHSTHEGYTIFNGNRSCQVLFRSLLSLE